MTEPEKPPEKPPEAPEPEATKASEPEATVDHDHDGWPLQAPSQPENVVPALIPDQVLPAPPPVPQAPQLPTAAGAAYEAARIVGEMVGDIESVQGAALVAAAAAGAAIEASRARMASGEVERLSLPPPPMPADATTHPEITARLQRDLILRALAEDIGASTASGAQPATDAAGQPLPPTARQSASPPTARVEPLRVPGGRAQPARTDELPGDDAGDDELDPVAIAAAAIARIRARARTNVAELRDQYHRYDVFVVVAALVIIAIAGRAYDHLVTPPTEAFDPAPNTAALPTPAGSGARGSIDRPKVGAHGLGFQHPRGWLAQVGAPLPPPRLARATDLGAPTPAKPDGLYHVELSSPIDPTARIEVLIDKKPAWSNIVTGLDLDRRTRWGELYALDDSSVRSVEDHQWLRTAYRFAHAPEKGDVPRIDRAVEYATIDREQIYVLTFFGSPAAIDRIEDVVAPTLRVATQTGLPLVPQTGHLANRKYPNAVSRAFESTVMIVAADVIDGRLHARGGGSGVVVGKDGSILTNFHVIHDQHGRLHDVFVIGRFSQQDKAPQLFCAGVPSRGKLQRELDLALIKCDLDLDGRAWSPTAAPGTMTGPTAWQTLALAKATDVKMGQRIWVLGYPDVGGGGLTLSEGEAVGWSGVDDRGLPPGSSAAEWRRGSIDGQRGSDGRGLPAAGSAADGQSAVGKDFLKTDAAIRHGNSGGPVVDDAGHLVGIASAVRVKQNAAGDVVEVVQAGGRVRPIVAASDLLAIASAGWTPREGHTDVELQPSAIEAPAEGIQIQSRVLDAASEAPVRDALVMVLRPGVSADQVDVNRLDDQVLAYGRSNAQGEVSLKQPVPVPGTYTLMVVARGYEPMIGENDLVLPATAPEVFDPWGKLLLRAR